MKMKKNKRFQPQLYKVCLNDAKRLCKAQAWLQTNGTQTSSTDDKEQARVVSCLYHYIYAKDQDTTPEYEV